MANLKKIVKGGIIFIGGFILALILNLVIPEIIDIGETLFTGSELAGIGWFGVIIIDLMLMIVLPAVFIIEGLKERTAIDGKLEMVAGIVWFVLTMILTVKGFWFITALAGMTSDTFLTILFWGATAFIWVLLTLITPASLIIEGSTGKQIL